MKRIFTFLFIITLALSCDVKDCFESEGERVQKNIEVPVFDKITVGNEIRLIMKSGVTQSVLIDTGENLIDAVSVKVIDNRLIVEDKNTCNFTREFALTKITVTSPNITEIRSNTARLIKSDGVLNFDSLTLISENFLEDALNIGGFEMDINVTDFRIIANGNSVFKISGTTTNFNAGFFAGSSRLEARDLITTNLVIVQKSSNDMLVKPMESITGTIYSTGDVISYNSPEFIEVEALYTGKLVFF